MIKFSDESIDVFLNAAASLKSKEEAENFFQMVCTKSELETFAQRLIIAKFLCDNMPYKKINDITSASPATVSRVNRNINNEPKNMFFLKQVFERLQESGYEFPIASEEEKTFSTSDFFSEEKSSSELKKEMTALILDEIRDFIENKSRNLK